MTTRRRLAPDDWLLAGLSALVAEGPDALKAEPLARRQGTTKGSFYWHFRDVPAFHSALLERWEADAYAAIVDELKETGTAITRLRRLPSLIPGDQAPTEAAIRAWATGFAPATEATKRVDTQRMTYIQGLLSEIGVPNPDMARLLYSAQIGLMDLDARNDTRTGESLTSLVDLVLALR